MTQTTRTTGHQHRTTDPLQTHTPGPVPVHDHARQPRHPHTATNDDRLRLPRHQRSHHRLSVRAN
ncbi:hypothetical protein, partial [Streptomyces mutabilis]|uniref:hypothetical protein n=1 Tax=Streptomyces mutabilis TaxID=67332 RepID=UPI0036A47334